MNVMKTNPSKKIEAFGFSYNIHNIIQVASMFELPELEYFRVPALTADPDIRVRLERRRKERRKASRNGWVPRRGQTIFTMMNPWGGMALK